MCVNARMTTSQTSIEQRIRLALVCEAPPAVAGTEFGLQDKSGGLKRGVPEPDGSLRFDGEIRAVTLPDGAVNLRGEIVHGPSSGRFLYLSCRPIGGASGHWIFRLKVPLTGVDL